MHFFGCESFVLKTFLSLLIKSRHATLIKRCNVPIIVHSKIFFASSTKSFRKRSKSVNFLHEILHKVWFCSDFCKVAKFKNSHVKNVGRTWDVLIVWGAIRWTNLIRIKSIQLVYLITINSAPNSAYFRSCRVIDVRMRKDWKLEKSLYIFIVTFATKSQSKGDPRRPQVRWKFMVILGSGASACDLVEEFISNTRK